MSPSPHNDTEMQAFKLTYCHPISQGPRLGSLQLGARNAIRTPHYVATTSRGIVPHLTQDLLRKHTTIGSVYMALEDFIEKAFPNVSPFIARPSHASGSSVRDFVALQDESLLILGPRRVPPAASSLSNSNSAIPILSSVGFGHLEVEGYNEAVRDFCPDIAVTIADIIATEHASRKRTEKSADRTHAWLRDSLSVFVHEGDSLPRKPTIFASIPPLEKEQQSLYLSDLVEEYRPNIDGLAIYSPSSTNVIPEPLNDLPRLCLSNPSGPHEILEAVAAGVDLITLPLISQYVDAGIAFTFEFPPPTDGISHSATKLALGLDMWLADHAVDMSPLMKHCNCYTCTHHHRAYIAHLLQAKEMLAWTLLQLHNHAVLDAFFSKVRDSIQAGRFKQDTETFVSLYDVQFPEQTGQGPRVRGYQTKSMGGKEPKKNPKAYGKLDDAAQRLMEADETVRAPAQDEDAATIESSGFAEKL
ncbi:MAG: hypothetical protein Q9227_003438 [Pyrenula ochraceoflavens]